MGSLYKYMFPMFPMGSLKVPKGFLVYMFPMGSLDMHVPYGFPMCSLNVPYGFPSSLNVLKKFPKGGGR